MTESERVAIVETRLAAVEKDVDTLFEVIHRVDDRISSITKQNIGILCGIVVACLMLLLNVVAVLPKLGK